MKKLSKFLKSKLNSIIETMDTHKELYLKNPRTDFIRKRKISFFTVVKFVLTCGSNSLNKELLSFCNFKNDSISASALVQQRNKLTPGAFEMLFKNFNKYLPQDKVLNGYRLIAVDGSDVNIPYNPNDKRTFISSKDNGRGFNQIHLNAAFDILNQIYVDVRIQEKCNHNEHGAFVDMVKNFPISDPSIFILDRGYESYNNFANVIRSGNKFIIRAKDIESKGILSSIKNKLPKTKEFSSVVSLKITRQQTNEVKKNKDIYKFLPDNSNFEFLPPGSKGIYEISFRVVRVLVEEDIYVSLITNLEEDEFSMEDIKKLYNLRWGIETSFRNLKYSLGLVNFHSKRIDFIVQEVYSKLIMYNFASAIANSIGIKQKKKHKNKINFSMAVYVIVDFIKNKKAYIVEEQIEKYLTPIREKRKYQRKIRTQSAVPFNYRAY